MAGEADSAAPQQTAGTAGAPEGGAPATSAVSPEELATLRRLAAQAQASQSRADTLAARVSEFEKRDREAQLAAAGAEGRLQVELEQARAAAAAAEQRARRAELVAQYPDALKALGDEALKLSDERLAALQVSLKTPAGTPEQEPPPPVGSNPQRQPGGSGKPVAEMTADEFLAKMKKDFPDNPWG